MENGCGFQTQLVSIMESLAKAALAEINRRVDDSCAVLRLEITQSQRDIDLLKNKCASMEGELKRTRMRVRRKYFYPPTTVVRCPPLVKVMLNQEERDSSTPQAWDRPMVASEEIMQPPQCVELEHAGETGPIVIKEETADEDVWKIDSHDNIVGPPPCFEDAHPAGADVFAEHYPSADNPTTTGPLLSSAECLDSFPEQRPGGLQGDGVELIVKHEKEEPEPDKNISLAGSDQTFVLEEADRQLWSTDPGRDASEPNFLYGSEHYQQSSSLFACQSGLPMTHSIPEDIGPPLHSGGKSLSPAVSAVRMKRRARTFGYKRPQTIHIPQEGQQGTLTQINTNASGSSLIPQSVQHQYTNSGPDMRNQNEGLMVPSLSASPYSGYSRAFSLGRRMRTPWRSGVGEKRFSCTYCTKSFMRFSQLKEHLRSHTGEKPFSCLQCGRSFTKQCNLIRHAVVHSGEKPYECALCGKCFTQRSSLKSHQKTAH